tara:strand:+ start:264 stop:536 length:273 start_codon:yes stop_codon:yes gene_type:complete
MNWEDTIKKYSVEPLDNFGAYYGSGVHREKTVLLIKIKDDLENLKRSLKFITKEKDNDLLLSSVRNTERGLPFLIKAIEKMIDGVEDHFE